MVGKMLALDLLAAGLYLLGMATTVRGCGWDSTWYNVSSPTAANKYTEHEPGPDMSHFDQICKSATAGGVIETRCKDDKGEPFQGKKNDTILHFYATCSPITGLNCAPHPGFANASCPDFSIQYGCNCANVQVTSPATSGAGGINPTTPPVASNTGNTGIAASNGNTVGAGNMNGNANTGSVTSQGGNNSGQTSIGGSGNSGSGGVTSSSGNSGNSGGTPPGGGNRGGNSWGQHSGCRDVTPTLMLSAFGLILCFTAMFRF